MAYLLEAVGTYLVGVPTATYRRGEVRCVITHPLLKTGWVDPRTFLAIQDLNRIQGFLKNC